MIGVLIFWLKKDGFDKIEITILIMADIIALCWWLYTGDGYPFWVILTGCLLLIYWWMDLSVRCGGYIFERVVRRLDSISYALWLSHPIVLLVLDVIKISVNWCVLLIICLITADIVTRWSDIFVRNEKG